MNYYNKYLKYKNKYLVLSKKMRGGFKYLDKFFSLLPLKKPQSIQPQLISPQNRLISYKNNLEKELKEKTINEKNIGKVNIMLSLLNSITLNNLTDIESNKLISLLLNIYDTHNNNKMRVEFDDLTIINVMRNVVAMNGLFTSLNDLIDFLINSRPIQNALHGQNLINKLAAYKTSP